METSSSSDRPESLFLATLTVSISNHSFANFIKSGTSSNYLPVFQQKLSTLQDSLESLRPRTLQFDLRDTNPQRGADRSIISSLENFSVTTITYSEGSVVAKIQIGCAVVFTTTAFLADYPDAKLGLKELRSDLIQIVNQIFDEEGIEQPTHAPFEDSSVKYYFLKPETAEENLDRIYRKKFPDSVRDQSWDLDENQV